MTWFGEAAGGNDMRDGAMCKAQLEIDGIRAAANSVVRCSS
jgi:hypothetical protein